MSNQNASFDDNGNASLLVASSTVSGETVAVKGDPTTGGMVSVVKAQYNASPPTVADAGLVNLQSDSSGNIKVYKATQLDPVNDSITTYPFGHSFTNITTNTTTTVKSGSGTLMGIKINNPALITVANLTITVYDNTAASGTLIGTMTVPFGLTTAVPFHIPFNLGFSTGLTIVTAGPTVTGNLTVEWR